jgi:hypothetical protein
MFLPTRFIVESLEFSFFGSILKTWDLPKWRAQRLQALTLTIGLLLKVMEIEKMGPNILVQLDKLRHQIIAHHEVIVGIAKNNYKPMRDFMNS